MPFLQVDAELLAAAGRARAQLEYLDTLHRTVALAQIPHQPFVGSKARTEVADGKDKGEGPEPS